MLIFSSKTLGRVLDKVEQTILEGKRLVAKAEAMLRQVEELNRRHGLSPEALEKYMQDHLSPAEREEVERQVQQALRELREEADRAAESLRTASRPPRKPRLKMTV